MINDTTPTLPNDKAFYTLPKFLSQLQHITTIDTGGLQFIICCDKLKLYIFPLIQGGNKPLGSVHQSLPIPNIKSLRAIAKNFLLIETQNKYLGIFQIIKSAVKQPATDKPVSSLQANTVKVQFSQVQKWRTFSSYFIREVMENLFEVQVFFTDLEFEIFHFTNKNKKGSMSFTISQNGRILKSTKKQLYGSKFFFNIGRKLIYWMKNFSDKQFIIQQIVAQPPMGSMKLQPFGYFGVQRAEQYKILSPNLVIRDCLNPAKRHSLQIEPDSFLNELKAQLITLSPSTKKKNAKQQQNPFNQLVQRDGISQTLENYKFNIFTDLLMIQNKQKKKMEIYQIRTEGSSIVAKQDSSVQNQKENISMLDLRRWQWYFGNSKKLIGIDRIGFKLKYVQQMSLRDKTQQIKENTQMITVSENKTQENKQQIDKETVKNESQKEKIQQKNTNIQNDNKQKELPRRKFSKDQLKKYCEEFDINKEKQHIDQNLIKKVDEINKSLQKSPQKVQTIKEDTSQLNDIKKQQNNGNSKQEMSQKKDQIKVQKQERIINSKTELNNKNDTLNQNNIGQNQQQLKTKQKPPVKIIQKNKISVAKSFISQQQSQSKESTDTKKQVKQDNREKVSNFLQNQKTQKVNLQIIKQEDAVKQQKVKKRFMQNYLSQQKKQRSKQKNKQQIQNFTKEELNKIKQSKQNQAVPQKQEKKQEKKKINVITRASLLKKKQNEELKQLQIKVVTDQEQTKIEQKKAPADQDKIQYFQQLTKQVNKQINQQSLKSDQLHKNKNTQNIEQQKPKTRYIPSIDIKKASGSQLNECQFLSEDSLSEQEEQTYTQKQKQLKKSILSYQEEQIQEQIQGQSGYSSGQEDMEYLIDDDLGKKNYKGTDQQKKQINPDEEIEKFCNNLLEENSTLNYQKTVTIQSSNVIKKQTYPNKNVPPKTDKTIKQFVNKTQIINSQQLIVSQLDKNATKQQTNEINQLNSLLFKTNIKRTNIFGSQQKSQEQIKSQQMKKKQQKEPNDHKEKNYYNEKSVKQSQKTPVQTSELQKVQLKSQHQESRHVENEKRVVEERKSKVWHDLSSDSDDERSSSENSQKQNTQQTLPKKQEEKIISKQQQKIVQTLQKQQKVVSQCTKILSDIQQHKTKKIQQKLLEQKPIEKTQAEQKIYKGQELKEIENDLMIQQKKTKPQLNIFTFPLPKFPSPNPFLASSQTPLFPTNTTPNWLSSRPPAHMIHKKDQNPFINFKKSLQETQSNHQNLFGLGENGNTNSSNLFRKFLNERQSKPEQIKEAERKIIQHKNIAEIKESQKDNENKQAEIKKRQQPLASQSQLIPSTLLPKIQQLITSFEQSTLTLLQKQQSTILKSLQQIPNTHNPYNKNHSLLLPEQIKEEIIKQSKNTVKKWLATKMLDKIQTSFRQIMLEHKKVYEDALKYYENQAKRRITTMQLQYEQQQTILTDIENVAANLSSALQGSVLQGEQMHTFQLKQWKNQITEAQNNLIQPLNQQIQDSKQFFNQRNKNLQNLGNQLCEIKQILKNKLKKKQQIKELKEKKKLKQLQSKTKQEETKKSKKIQQQPKKSKSQKLKNQTQTHPLQYYQPPQYGQYEPQYYTRLPYPYY